MKDREIKHLSYKERKRKRESFLEIRITDLMHFKDNPKQDDKLYEDPYSNNYVRNHPMMIMVNERQIDLLQHPLSLALMKYKWDNFG